MSRLRALRPLLMPGTFVVVLLGSTEVAGAAATSEGNLTVAVPSGLAYHLTATTIVIALAHVVERLFQRALVAWHSWHERHPSKLRRTITTFRSLRKDGQQVELFLAGRPEEAMRNTVLWCLITLALYIV